MEESRVGAEVATDSDQAQWNAYVEETLKMAAKCEQIWKEKMKREESTEAGFATSESDPQFSPRRFWSWRCAGYMTAQRWRIRRRTRLNPGVF
jgi:hypothetical protein